jgi:hypothetical protein
MKILVDQEEIDLFPLPQTFKEIQERIIHHCAEKKRIALKLLVDGHLVEFKGDLPQGITLENLELLEVTTGSTRDVATNVLRGCAEHIPRLEEGLTEAATVIRRGQQQEGMNILASSIDLWLELVSGTENAMRVSGLEWNAVRVGLPGVPEESVLGSLVVSQLDALLEEIQRVIEDQNQVELIDILEYDLPPVLKAYQEALFALADLAGRPVH